MDEWKIYCLEFVKPDQNTAFIYLLVTEYCTSELYTYYC
jgi:hypothetical protein